MPDICKTDLLRTISYLEEAAKLYEALPTQTITTSEGKVVSLLKVCRLRERWAEGKCRCRAYMINQLIHKLKSKIQ